MSVYNGLFLLNGLSETEKKEIISSLPAVVNFKKGEIIYSPESFKHALGFIVSGCAVVVTDNSKRLVMKRLSAGSCFGAAAVFGNSGSYVSTVSAVEPCEIVFISEEMLTRLFNVHPNTAISYIAFLSDKIRFLNKKLSLVSCGDAEDTVLKYLSLSAGEDGCAVIPESMTMLASMLGLGRASLYRSLEALEQHGDIVRENDRIRVKKK